MAKAAKKCVLAVVGIDTDIGKSIATGMMARFLHRSGINAVTQKMVQTGCTGISEDIITHRKLTGIDPLPQDRSGTTCPCLFAHPASPHLAAEMENKKIDPRVIHEKTCELLEDFDLVLLEAAGGLQVPLTRQITVLDYIHEKGLPVVLVTCSRLGSINHTLLSLEALKARKIKVKAVIYNTYPETDPHITADSITVIRKFLDSNNFKTAWVEMGRVDMDKPGKIDFSGLFKCCIL